MVKKKSAIPYSSRAPIRHAYDQVLTCAARLIAFAACPLLPEWGEVEKRQEQLALDDLISFAIHVRRLLENTGLELGKAPMTTFSEGKSHAVPIMRVVNTIIHSRQIEVWRREADYMPVPKKYTNETLTKRIAAHKVQRPPIVIVKSDRSGLVAFRIDHMTTSVVQRIVGPVVQYCDENELYLEDMEVD